MTIAQPYFSQTVQAALAGQIVRVDTLVQFDFLSSTMYLRTGKGSLLAGGRLWRGLGAMAVISGLQLGPNAPTTPLKITLSGLDMALAALVPSQQTEVRNRPLTVYTCHFDADWQVLDAPYVIRTAFMDRLLPRMNFDSNEMAIDLMAEAITATRHMARHSYLTDVDQQARHAGDRILERCGLYVAGGTRQW